MTRRIEGEFEAMSRRASRETTAEMVALLIVLGGLFFGIAGFAGYLDRKLGSEPSLSTAIALGVLFYGAFGYVMWSFCRKQRVWSDDSKDVISLQKFTSNKRHAPILAPNLEDEECTLVLERLKQLASRDDVLEVLVARVPDVPNTSDRVLIETYAPDADWDSWEEMLFAELASSSSLKYRVDGIKRKVRSLVYVWD